MGAESSTLCSTASPNGYGRGDLHGRTPIMDPTSACAAGRATSRIPMQFTDAHVLEGEKINKWTKDLGDAGHRFGPEMISALSCGNAQAAPQDYLADTQDGHAIVMDSREGPAFVDVEDEDVEVGLHPGESSAGHEAKCNVAGRMAMLKKQGSPLSERDVPRGRKADALASSTRT
eukprot:TRINITY_DN73002_c0_g1_i1.p1 TRINITY_DN73002_c0_g1~~TRINITY_DN73002_c0_g1_i1.p1  ORF type:complete len:175 (-),score=29.55 TRINITY_DN73002_c0_g1_i1:41-565(-)